MLAWTVNPAHPATAATPAYRVERGLSRPVQGPVELALSGSSLIWQELGPNGVSRLVGVDLRSNRRWPSGWRRTW
jgi:hypothetical protein